MSLRAEYKVTAELDLESLWTVFVHHNGKEVRQMTKVYTSGLIETSSQLIREHMEKVTRILDSGPIEPEKAEEIDRLSHRGDQQQQEEADHS